MKRLGVYIGIVFALGLLAVSIPAFAQVDTGLEYTANIGLGTADVRDTAATIINVLLGLLGIIAVIIVLYGGFRYMTSAGDPAKVDQARKILIAGGIGLAIIASAYAIAFFVIRTLGGDLVGGPQGPGPGGDGGPGPGGDGFFSGCPDPIPSDPAPFICKLLPNEGPIGQFVTVKGGKFGGYDTGSSRVYITAKTYTGALDDVSCDGSSGCFTASITSCDGDPSWTGNEIVIEVPPLQDTSAFSDGDFVANYDFFVATSSGDSSGKITEPLEIGRPNNEFTLEGGEAGPGIACLQPNIGREGDAVDILGVRFGETQDDSLVDFNDVLASAVSWAQELIQTNVPPTASSGPVSVTVSGQESNGVDFYVTCSDDTQCSTGCCYFNFCAEADPWCLGGEGDSCLGDTDCAGDLVCEEGVCSEPELPGEGQSCGTVEGDVCSVTTECQVGNQCNEDSCICDAVPTILAVSPADGSPGNFITIHGLNFGDEPGRVFFTGTDFTFSVEAFAPAACETVDTWKDSQIIVEVPEGAIDGAIRVETAAGVLEDTNDANGPFVPHFDVNNISRPGLCDFVVKSTLLSQGMFGDEGIAIGQNFAEEEAVVLLSGQLLGNQENWEVTSSTIDGPTIPNLQAGSNYQAQIQQGEVFSNTVEFTVLETPQRPSIDFIDIEEGPVGQFVTVSGSNFGVLEGEAALVFEQGADQITQAAKIFNFPPQCSDTQFWNDNQIIFTVPQTTNDPAANPVTPGQKNIFVINSEGLDSNRVTFDVCTEGAADCTRTPGICGMEPMSGPAETTGVQLFGEGFGVYGPQSNVVFFNNQIVTDAGEAWSDFTIGTGIAGDALTVPTDAQTGPVSVVTNAGAQSNSVTFTVQDCREEGIECGEGTICCGDGSCRTECAQLPPLSNLNYTFTTGRVEPIPGLPRVKEQVSCEVGLQSPSPYLNSESNCLNAQISAQFADGNGLAVPMEVDNFTESTIVVRQCDDGDEFDPATCTTPVASSSITPLGGDAGFVYATQNPLQLNTWYQVTLVSGPEAIRSAAGLWLDGDSNNVPGGDYEWHFRVWNDPNACVVNDVEVLPDSATLENIGDELKYSASVVAQNCNILDPSQYEWDWISRLQNGDDGSGVATISRDDLLPQGAPDGIIDWIQSALAIFQGLTYIGSTPFDLSVTPPAPLVLNDLNNRLVVDLGIPVIDFIYPRDGLIDPRVTSYVTIYGDNFGVKKGNSKVLFGDVEASLASCSQPWSDTKVKVKVPGPKDIAATNPVQPSINTSGAALELEARESGMSLFAFNESSTVLAVDQTQNGDGVLTNVDKVSSPFGGSAVLFGFAEGGAASYMEAPSHDLPSLAEGTIELVFNADDPTPLQTIFKGGDVSIDIENNTLTIQPWGVDLGTQIVANNWYHLAVTLDDENLSRAYVNGQQVWAGGLGAADTFFDDGAEFAFIYLGAADADGTNQFAGAVDNLAIYTASLSPQDVTAHYGLDPEESGMLALYAFEESGVDFRSRGQVPMTISSDTFPTAVESIFGQAVDFSGANAYIQVRPDISQTSRHIPYAFHDGVSVAAWVRTPNTADLQKIVSSGAFELTVGSNPQCGSNTICFEVAAGPDGQVFYAGADANTALTEEWNYIVGTYDNQTIRLYVNGKEAGSFGAPQGLAFEDTGAPICLGATADVVGGEPACANQWFSGAIDSVAVYNAALASKDIAKTAGIVGIQDVQVVTAGGESNTVPFTPSENIYPFVCELEPNYGPEGETLTLTGDNFGDDNLTSYANEEYNVGSYVYFGNSQMLPGDITRWSNNTIEITNPFGAEPIPSLPVWVQIDPLSEPYQEQLTEGVYTPGLEDFADTNGNGSYDKETYDAEFLTGGEPPVDNVEQGFLKSNEENFYFAPVIEDITPDQGPVDQWVTITGFNFGDTPGQILFTGPAGEVIADLAPCAVAWTNTYVIARVPAAAISGQVSLVSAAGIPSVNSVPFEVTDGPLGPGLCQLSPNRLLGGDDVDLIGVRFGSFTPQGEVTIDGDNLGVIDAGLWSDTSVNVTTDPETESGLVQISVPVQVGEECAGFSIGTFCPGGQYDPVFESVPSNGLPLTISDICEDGLLTTQNAVSSGWPKSFHDPIYGSLWKIHTEYVATDGSWIYAAGEDSDSGIMSGFIWKIGTGQNGTTLGKVVKMNYFTGNLDPIREADGLFVANDQLYRINTNTSLYRVETVEVFGSTRESIDLIPLAVPEPFIEAFLGETERSGANSKYNTYFATSNGQHVINVGYGDIDDPLLTPFGSYDGYWVKVFDPGNGFALVDEYQIADDSSFSEAELRGIVADDEFLYLNTQRNTTRLVDLATHQIIDEWSDGNLSYESNGQWDPETGAYYIGTLAGFRDGMIYAYDGCAPGAGDSCVTSSDCTACGFETACVAGTCAPNITAVSPNDGAIGSWITLQGCYFGDDPGAVNFSGAVGADPANTDFNRPGITPDVALCGDTWTDTRVLIEVPDVNSTPNGENQDLANDAVDGPIELISQATLRTDTAEDGLPDFNVTDAARPAVCALVPNEGDVGDVIEVRGKGFGSQNPGDRVTFKGTTITGDEQVMQDFALCSGPGTSWSDSRICGEVPNGAVTGPVEVTNDGVESQNRVPFSVGVVQRGPQILTTVPVDGDENFCRNGIVEIYFDSIIDEQSVIDGDSIELFACQGGFGEIGLLDRIRQFFAGLFGRSVDAQMFCSSPTLVDVSYEFAIINDASVVSVAPEITLDPAQEYYLEIDGREGGLVGANGVRMNHQVSDVTGETLVSGLSEVEQVFFSTLGTEDDFDSGICVFDDVQVSVYNTNSISGRIANNDFYVCAGDNCFLNFDYDQAPVPPFTDKALVPDAPEYEGNQHRYVAKALSQQNVSASFADNFETGNLGAYTPQGAGGCGDYTVNPLGRLEKTGACASPYNLMMNEILPDGVPFSVEVDMQVLPDTGIIVGGNRISVTSDGRYAINGTEFSREGIATGFKKLVIEHVGATLQLTVDGLLQVEAGGIVNDGTFGFYYGPGATQSEWDNFAVSTYSVNTLKGIYTWSRSDVLDPIRLVTLQDADDALPDDADKVSNESGETYAHVEPIAQGSTKIVVEATTDAAGQSNVVSQEFFINVFICENPWPNVGQQFVDSVYNFVTFYCRDGDNVTDPADDLPAAQFPPIQR